MYTICMFAAFSAHDFAVPRKGGSRVGDTLWWKSLEVHACATQRSLECGLLLGSVQVVADKRG